VVVSAPSAAWCFLQGASPCLARPNQPPVPSVAGMEKYFIPGEMKCLKRTQGTLQAAGETYLPKAIQPR
jgi:hypothetical protein